MLMNMETVSVWAQLLGSVSVIVSLFYLAVQIRQNTRSARVIVVDSLARSMHDLAFEIAQSDELLRLATSLQDWNSATELERARYGSLILGYFKLFENAWFQMRKGTLERDQWEGYDAFIRTVLAHPTVKTWWPMRRAFFARGFRQYVESCKLAPSLPSLPDLVQKRTPPVAAS